ncbi:MAG TPA: F0F1 ATP synthase subunit A, partial [Chitinophagaceae bacterium]|nr:F0F1 ATP synthase subunit A [Chitinophagaceae bacterium]
MSIRRVKSTMVAAFSLLNLLFCAPSFAQQTGGETAADEKHHESGESKFDANEVIFGHVMDAHEFHFFSYKGSDDVEHHATIPLPVILYSPQKGVSTFMSSRFEHGHAEVAGYKLEENKIVATEPGVTVYDLSLTRNVVQMFIAVALLLLIMTSIARRYKTGQGVTTAPKGWQNAIEPVITFVRDEVARPNIGPKYGRFMPLLLTIFFFILIN